MAACSVEAGHTAGISKIGLELRRAGAHYCPPIAFTKWFNIRDIFPSGAL
jgi:hypothetical protein